MRSDYIERLLEHLQLLFNLGCGFAIRGRPDLFIARAGHVSLISAHHVWLISAQLASFIGSLVYVARFFSTSTRPVLRSREVSGRVRITSRRFSSICNPCRGTPQFPPFQEPERRRARDRRNPAARCAGYITRDDSVALHLYYSAQLPNAALCFRAGPIIAFTE